MTNYDEIKDRYQELLNEAKGDIAKQLNEEFDEIIIVVNHNIFVDCSDFGQPNVKIS